MRIKHYILPALYGASYAMAAAPCFSGYREYIITQSLAIIVISSILVVVGTKILIGRSNYLALLIIAVLIVGYSLKLAYIESLLVNRNTSESSDMVIATMFDTFNVGYLDYTAQTYGVYIAYYTALLLAIIGTSLILPTPDYATTKLKVLLNPNRSTKLHQSVTFILSFCVAGSVGLALLNSISFGISSGDASVIVRLPYKIDTAIYLLLRYGLSLIGATRYIKVCNTNPPNKYALATITKAVIISYFMIFSLYSTSKEYLFVAMVLVVYDVVKRFLASSKARPKRASPIIKMLLSLTLVAVVCLTVLSINTASRFIRNGICLKCSGIQASQYAIVALIDGSNATLQEILGNDNSLVVSQIDKLALSTVFRVQGADNLMQILNKNHTSSTFPDFFGPIASFSGIREPGHEFFFYRILPYQRIGRDLAVAFPPSLVGLSIQASRNIMNPVIFGVATYSIFALLIYTLLSVNSALSNLVGILITYEALKTFSEGTVSTQLLGLALSIVVIYKLRSLSVRYKIDV